MNEQRTFYRSFWPPHGAEVVGTSHHRAVVEAASREAAEREMAMLRALNPPRLTESEPPPLRSPSLPEDFGQRLKGIDNAIVGRGLPVDESKLLSLGRERFQKLLEADRQARASQSIIGAELTTGAGVLQAFAVLGATEASGIPRLRISQAYAGVGRDREAVRPIKCVDDLWKWTGEPQLVKALFAYRNAFETLGFGRSLVEHIEEGRAYTQFFARGASGRKVALFGDWVSVLPRSITSVAIVEPVTTVFAWLLGQQLMPPTPHDFFTERLASAQQRKYTEALWNGFLLGLKGWHLWEHVGRRTRQAPDAALLEEQLRRLNREYPTVREFHAKVLPFFYQAIGDHREFQPSRFRRYIDAWLRETLDAASGIVAQAIEQVMPDSLVARFQAWFLLEGKPPANLHERIREALGVAFPGSAFAIQITERP
jgi:hypothetical protein